MPFSEAQYALVGTIIGGIGLKLTEYFINRTARLEAKRENLAKLSQNDEQAYRDDLREDIRGLKEELSGLYKRFDEVQIKYWDKSRELSEYQIKAARLMQDELERRASPPS